MMPVQAPVVSVVPVVSVAPLPPISNIKTVVPVAPLPPISNIKTVVPSTFSSTGQSMNTQQQILTVVHYNDLPIKISNLPTQPALSTQTTQTAQPTQLKQLKQLNNQLNLHQQLLKSQSKRNIRQKLQQQR